MENDAPPRYYQKIGRKETENLFKVYESLIILPIANAKNQFFQKITGHPGTHISGILISQLRFIKPSDYYEILAFCGILIVNKTNIHSADKKLSLHWSEKS